MKDKLKQILTVNQEELLRRTLINRQINLEVGLEKVQAILGPRRVGKTSAMALVVKELVASGHVPASHILYFNFEDERVQFTPQSLDLILQAWQELYPDHSLRDVWFFFDEVQAAQGWEQFINRINETTSKKIFFTGSNASVLHTKVKSVLRGRSIPVEILPLSFKEYCEFIGTKPVIYGTGKSKTIAAFHSYLEKGGYPEIATIASPVLQTTILQEYYSAMVLRDIIEYNQLSNYSHLRSLFRMAAAGIGKTLTIRRLHNQLKANGYSVGINSIYEIMDMAENAYLFKRISRFDFSDSKREKSEKKIYWLDNGLLTANTLFFSGNKGLLLENLVFRELYRRYGSIYETGIFYYGDQTSECDFILFSGNEGSPLPVQVCWDMADPETRKREIKGLIKACAYCRVTSGWILTGEEEDIIDQDGIRIEVKAVWKWLLQPADR